MGLLECVQLMVCLMCVGLAALLLILAKVIEIQNYLKKGKMKL